MDSQLDSLQYALAGAVAAAHQTTESGKREILIPLGGVVETNVMVKQSDGKWKLEKKTETVKVTEKVVEPKVLATGMIAYEETVKETSKNKLRTTSEYIRIPQDRDIFELSAAPGTPLSEPLLSALLAGKPSSALSVAKEAYWGEVAAQSKVKVKFYLYLPFTTFLLMNACFHFHEVSVKIVDETFLCSSTASGVPWTWFLSLRSWKKRVLSTASFRLTQQSMHSRIPQLWWIR